MDASAPVASARTPVPQSPAGFAPPGTPTVPRPSRSWARILTASRGATLTVSAAVLMTLSGCASPPPVQPTEQQALLRDDLFPPSTERIDPDQVMTMSPKMREFIHNRIPRPSSARFLELRDARHQLLDALYAKGELQLEYDAEQTRTAAEAFEAKAGNCLSLAMMTAVFAREVGLPVLYRQVYDEEQWARVGDLQVVSGHVNVALGRRPNDFRVMADDDPNLVVDFLPGVKIRSQRAMLLDERTIVAMYLNNRAAELMTQGQLDRAYWWARAAWLHEPKLLNALNTMGVIYRRHGNAAAAEAAFRAVLQRETANTQAMSNLASLLRVNGRFAEAKQYEERLAQLQPYPPFKFFDLGVAEMKAGRYAEARDLFAKEISRSAYYHEFHFWMALANVGLGNWDVVRKELVLAEEYSTTIKQRQLYTAKLDSLKAKMSARGRTVSQ